MSVIEKPRSSSAGGPAAGGAATGGLAANAGGRAGGAALAIEQVVPAHLLDGGEIVYFAIKPSPWFVLLVSLRWVAFGLALAVVSMMDQVPLPAQSRWYLYQLGFWLAAGRLGWGLLEWVSRLYVLTNRKAMRIRGVFSVEVFTCSLDRIQNTYVTATPAERMTRTGSVTFQTAAGGAAGTASWRIVTRPLEVHEKLREAIGRARNRGNHG